MTDKPGFAGYTDVSPLRRNRERLGAGAAAWRLVWWLCALCVAAQYLVPVLVRLFVNGGRVFPNDEPGISGGLALSVPVWLTAGTVIIGSVAGVVYLVTRTARGGSDVSYVGMLSLLFFAGFPWLIAALDVDPTGVVSTPGENGYPIGWHWIVFPCGIVVLGVALVVAVRDARKTRKERSNESSR